MAGSTIRVPQLDRQECSIVSGPCGTYSEPPVSTMSDPVMLARVPIWILFNGWIN
jgi:hypothetical protein